MLQSTGLESFRHDLVTEKQQQLSFVFLCVHCNFSFFISNFTDLSPLPYFLMNLAKGLSVLFIFPKNQFLVSLIFVIVFFVSCSFISAPIFMISFLLLTLGFVCSFSGCFSVR